MAALPDADRAELHGDLMREYPRGLGSISIVKAELRAAVDAIDDWVVANAASLNTAIPQPARGALNAQQKAWLLARVIERRYLKGA